MEPLFPSQAPQSLPEHLRWRTIRLKAGTLGPVMLAGPPVGVYTHHPSTRTVPCLRTLPGCSLQCPWCRFSKRFSVWVPVFDFNARKQTQLVVLGGKRTYESIAAAAPGTLVTVTRGEKDRDTPLFRPAPEQRLSTSAAKFIGVCPVDITRYLLHLWQWRELTEHFGEQFYPSIATTEIETGLRKMDHDGPRAAHNE